MELDLEIYSHLIKSGVVEGGFNNPAHKIFLDSRKVLLDQETSQDEQQSRIHYKIEEAVLTQLRPQVTPSIRLHNWNIIIKEIMKLGIKVNADMKSLIVAGDYGIILEYLRQLHNFELVQSGLAEGNQNSQLQKPLNDSYEQFQGGTEPAVDIGDMDVNKNPNETITCLEFLLNIICKNFQMNPKQAAGLLTNANKYLNIALIKGIKGEFDPIISFFQDVYTHSKHMTSLIEHETNYNLTNSTLFLMLNAFKGGFLSQHEEVVSWCCRLYAKIAFDLGDAGEIIGQAWDWFIDENQGTLETCLQALKKHMYILDSMVPVFINFAKYNFAELFTHHIRKYLNISTDYLNLMHDLIQPLNETKFSRDELQNSGTLDFFIEHCILKGDTTTGGIDTTKNDRQAAICFLSTMWIMYQQKFDKIIETFDETSSKSRIFQHLKSTQVNEQQTLGQITLTILKRNCRDKSQSLRMCALAQLFRLLDNFASERNQNAPVIFKTLIFAIIENHSNELIRQHMMTNFQYIFERINTIPVGILVDPLAKQIQISEGYTFKFNVFDFDFFSTMARHSRLTIKNAIQIADLMAKQYLNENQLDFQTSASVPLMLVVTRFLDHQATQEFIIKFISVGISIMTTIEVEMNEKNVEKRQKVQEFESTLEQQKQKRVPKKKWPPELDLAEQLKPPEETSEEIELRAKQLIKRHRIIEITKKLVKYRNQDLNEEIKIILLSALQKFIEKNKVESKGICHLLDWWWGKPQTLLQEFIVQQKQQEVRHQQELDNIERQYQSQYERVPTDEAIATPQQRDSEQFFNFDRKSTPLQQKSTPNKSIMMKDVVQNKLPPIKQQQQINKSLIQQNPSIQKPTQQQQQKPQQIASQPQLIKQENNDFYSIIQKSQVQDSKKPPISQQPGGLLNQRNFSLPDINQSHKSVLQAKPIKRSFLQEEISPRQKSNKAISYHMSTKKSPSEVSMDENYYKLLKYQQIQLAKNQNSKSQANLKDKQMLQLLPYDNFLSSKQVDIPSLRKQPKDKRVLYDIEKINQRRQEKEYKKFLDLQIKQYREEKSKTNLKQELERRKLDLGIAPSSFQRKPLIPSRSRSRKKWRNGKLTVDQQEIEESDNQEDNKMDVVILDEGEKLPEKFQIKKFLPPMSLIDINTEEEERDRINIQIWMQKYARLFKHLFNKYVNTIRNISEQNFDIKEQKGKSFNLAEILKFCKDHGILQEYLTKDEIQSLIRLISIKSNRKEEVMQLDQEQFSNFYIQMSHNIFYCKQGHIQWPLLQQMEQLMKVMQKAMLYKGENIGLYEDPEYVVGMDKQKLRQLNQQIQINPLLEIPEDFYKVYEREIKYEYTLPEYLPINESKRIAIETLDNIVNELFGMHFLEARGHPTVVPKIKQHEKIVTGKHHKNLTEIQMNIPPQTQQQQIRPIQQQFESNLQTEINNVVEQFGIPKQDVEQVALVIQKMLDKIDPILQEKQQISQVTQQNPQIVNKIQQEKLKKQLEEDRLQHEREQKRLQHEKQIKQKMLILAQQKEAQEYDKKRFGKEQELSEFEKKKRAEEKRQREFDQKKKALEEKKQRDMEELQRQKEEEQERRSKNNELKLQQQKDFLKQQKDKLKKNFETKINDRKDLETVQKQVQEQVNQKMNKIKSNMVDYIGKTKEERKQQDEKQKQEVDRFMELEETKNVFQKFDKGLKQYFKYYASQDKQQIEFDLEKKNESINMKEFIKFSYQSNIYPALISHEDLLYLFRLLVRERYNSLTQSKDLKDQLTAEEIDKFHSLDYDFFKKALIRIAALAQDRLSGQQVQQSRVQSKSLPKRNIGTANSLTNLQNQENGSLTRKTKEIYQIKQLQEHAPTYGTKIEDLQVTKPLRIETLTTKILETLIQFLDIGPGDTAAQIAQKIHNSRIEIAGQKPTRLKKEEIKKLTNTK